MPCDSSVAATKMTEKERLAEALRALGYSVNTFADSTVVGSRNGTEDLTFVRTRIGAPFAIAATEINALRAVQRKYSEIGVRQWAKRRGYNVASAEGDRKFTFVKRRG